MKLKRSSKTCMGIIATAWKNSGIIDLFLACIVDSSQDYMGGGLLVECDHSNA